MSNGGLIIAEPYAASRPEFVYVAKFESEVATKTDQAYDSRNTLIA